MFWNLNATVSSFSGIVTLSLWHIVPDLAHTPSFNCSLPAPFYHNSDILSWTVSATVTSLLVHIATQPVLRNRDPCDIPILHTPCYRATPPQNTLMSRTLFQLPGVVRLSFGWLVRWLAHPCRVSNDCHLLYPGKALHSAWQAGPCLHLWLLWLHRVPTTTFGVFHRISRAFCHIVILDHFIWMCPSWYGNHAKLFPATSIPIDGILPETIPPQVLPIVWSSLLKPYGLPYLSSLLFKARYNIFHWHDSFLAID